MVMNLPQLLAVMSKFAGGNGKGSGGKGGWGGKGGRGKGGRDSTDAKEKAMAKLREISNDRKVWIGGLPESATWKEVEKHFQETCGIKPSITELMSRGKGVCAFKTSDDAENAIASVNGTELKGKTLEVDVWTQKEKGGGGGGGGDEKWALVQKIKDMQRSDADLKAKWWAFTDEHHGGIHDPKKHDQTVLEEFLSSNPFEGDDNSKSALIIRIKSLQRSDADTKAKWWAFCDEHHDGVHDPKKLDKAVLQEFLSAY